jgi:OOP family OmpA-OmpF porin
VKTKLIILSIASTFFASSAMAADQGWYVLGGLGQSTSTNGQSTLDNAVYGSGGSGFSSSYSKGTFYNIDLGYQFNKFVAVEGGYIGSGGTNYSASGGNLVTPINASANISGAEIAAVGFIPLTNNFSLLGKLGATSITESASVNYAGGLASVNGTVTAATYGIGAQYYFNSNLFGRLDLDSYSMGDPSYSSRVDVWTVNIGYHF